MFGIKSTTGPTDKETWGVEEGSRKCCQAQEHRYRSEAQLCDRQAMRERFFQLLSLGPPGAPRRAAPVGHKTEARDAAPVALQPQSDVEEGRGSQRIRWSRSFLLWICRSGLAWISTTRCGGTIQCSGSAVPGARRGGFLPVHRLDFCTSARHLLHEERGQGRCVRSDRHSRAVIKTHARRASRPQHT